MADTNQDDETMNESIKIEKEEKGYTEDMKKYTYFIENLIENEQNNLTKLYDEFKGVYTWVKKEVSNAGNTKLKNAAIKQQILEKCTLLRADAEKKIVLLNTIEKSTINEEETDNKKKTIKITMERSYKNQKDLDKVVHYPRDITSMINQVIGIIQKSENLAEKDIDIEEKTKTLIKKFMELTKNVHELLDRIITNIIKEENIASTLINIEEVLKKLDQELTEFKNLDKLERIHLQLLLEIYKEEEEALEKEKQLDEAQTDFDQEEGYQTDQDGSIIIKES